jgi:hypothetical protein
MDEKALSKRAEELSKRYPNVTFASRVEAGTAVIRASHKLSPDASTEHAAPLRDDATLDACLEDIEAHAEAWNGWDEARINRSKGVPIPSGTTDRARARTLAGARAVACENVRALPAPSERPERFERAPAPLETEKPAASSPVPSAPLVEQLRATPEPKTPEDFARIRGLIAAGLAAGELTDEQAGEFRAHLERHEPDEHKEARAKRRAAKKHGKRR